MISEQLLVRLACELRILKCEAITLPRFTYETVKLFVTLFCDLWQTNITRSVVPDIF
jgi:hypothetical protein